MILLSCNIYKDLKGITRHVPHCRFNTKGAIFFRDRRESTEYKLCLLLTDFLDNMTVDDVEYTKYFACYYKFF